MGSYKPGQVITDSLANTNEQTGAVVFQARRQSSQTITTATDTAISWTAADIDTQGGWSGGAPTRFTPTVAGYYKVDFKVGVLSTAATFWVAAFLKKNGSDVSGSRRGAYRNWTSTNGVNSASMVVEMNGTTDYLEGIVVHTRGSNVSTANSSLDYCIITITYAGPSS